MLDDRFVFDKKEALETFSNGFQRFLDRTGLKVKDIASAFDLTKAAVSSWKNGVSFPDYPKIFKLLEMGMTLDEMFGIKIAKTERMNRLIVETEEIKNHLSLWQKSSFSASSIEIPDEQSRKIEESLNTQIIENEKEIAHLKMELKLYNK